MQFKPTTALSKTTMLSVSATPGGSPSVTLNGCAALAPAQACATGQNCGTASDGCGNTVSFGTCTSPQTCMGTPSHCATAAALSLSPVSGDFGNVVLGTPKDTIFTLKNGGTLDATGIAVAVTGTGFSRIATAGDCGTTLAGGASCSIDVRFTAPGLTAAQTGTLGITAAVGGTAQLALRGNPIGILAVPFPAGTTAVGLGGMSSAGTVLAGHFNNTGTETGFYWTVGTNSIMPVPPAIAGETVLINAVSGNGLVVGGCENASVLRWSPGQATPTLLGPAIAGGSGCAFGLDTTGATMVGVAEDSAGDGSSAGFVWRASTGTFQFAQFSGQNNIEIFALSSAGIAAGRANDPGDLGVWWAIQGATIALGVPLATLPNFTSFARGVSANGAVIVGEADIGNTSSQAVRWDTPFNAQPAQLPTLPGVAGAVAWAANQDGTVIVGGSGRAVEWTAAGIQAIDGALALAGVSLSGFTLSGSATAVSSDGKIISGSGTINGSPGIWIARLP